MWRSRGDIAIRHTWWISSPNRGSLPFTSFPARIAALEAEQAQLGQRLADPELYRSDAAAVKTLKARYGEIEEQLLQLLERWESLEARAK